MKEKGTRWKTSLSLFSIYLCVFIFLTGCGTDKDSGVPEFKPDPDITPGDISDKLVARIYFDATLSMQGFVAPGSTDYTRICSYLDSVIVSGWGNEEVKFFRFGEQVESINRDTYLQVGDESFYQTDIGIKTYIEKVIENEAPLVNPQKEASRTPETGTETVVNDAPEETEANSTEGRLVVIVTDLFQDNGDINRLLPELKEKYIKKRLDVGLFGLRSQFDGRVYDIGSGAESSLRYRGPRPFYLLVLGRHADIAHYFDSLIENGFPEAKTIIFSRYLVDPLLSFDGASIEPENLNNKTFVRSEDRHLKQYEIVESSDPAKISAKSMKYDPLPYAMSFDSDTFEVSIIAECKPDPNGQNDISWKAQECLEVTSTLLESENGSELSELRVDFNLNSESLPDRTVYLYEVILYPETNSYQAPEWCSEWNMGAERNGAKTLNLVNFVRNLSRVTARNHRPKIAKFHCYIGKR